jgi:hypothetical protein
MHVPTAFLLVLSLAFSAAVGSPAPKEDPSIRVSLSLQGPTSIEIVWEDDAKNADGYVVEWTASLESDFVRLDYLAPHVRSYKHVDLIPESPSYYRVRRIHGSVSDPVEIRLPADLKDAEYVERMAGSEDYTWAIPKRVPQPLTLREISLRTPKGNPAAAVPTHVRARLMPVTVSGFEVTWYDHTNDEEGFLLELKTDQKDTFEVRAVVEPNINSIGYALEPPQRKGWVRVRAYYLGTPSSIVSLITGPEKK